MAACCAGVCPTAKPRSAARCPGLVLRIHTLGVERQACQNIRIGRGRLRFYDVTAEHRLYGPRHELRQVRRAAGQTLAGSLPRRAQDADDVQPLRRSDLRGEIRRISAHIAPGAVHILDVLVRRQQHTERKTQKLGIADVGVCFRVKTERAEAALVHLAARVEQHRRLIVPLRPAAGSERIAHLPQVLPFRELRPERVVLLAVERFRPGGGGIAAVNARCDGVTALHGDRFFVRVTVQPVAERSEIAGGNASCVEHDRIGGEHRRFRVLRALLSAGKGGEQQKAEQHRDHRREQARQRMALFL